MAHRTEVTSEGEPLFTEEMAVQEIGNSLGHTMPIQARQLLGIAKGDEVDIEIYEDGYFVTATEDDGSK